MPAAPAETRSDAEIERAKLFEKGLFTAVDAMDNNALSAVYQGLISKQTDGFKKELARIINHPDVAPATKALAEKAFADLSRVEAMVVSEISRRIILDKTPENEKANVPSLMERYAGADSLTGKLAAGTWTLGGPAAPASDATLTVAAGALAFAADDAATGVALSFADGAALGVVMPGGQSPGSTGVILTNGLAAAGATLPVRVIAPDADKGDSFRLAAFTAPAATVDALLPKLAGTASHAASAAVTFSASAAYDLGGVSVKTVTASISPAAFVIVVR